MKPLPKWDRFFRLNALLALAVFLAVIGLGWAPIFLGSEYDALFSILIFFAIDFGGAAAAAVAAVALLVGWAIRGKVLTMIGLAFQLLYGGVYTWVGIRVEFMTPASLGALPSLALAVAGLAVVFTTPKGERRWRPKPPEGEESRPDAAL